MINSTDNKEGKKIYDFCKSIFAYHRSITGEGVRLTLHDIDEYLKKECGLELKMYEISSGTSAFDWKIPREWRINEAYIEDERGYRIIDMKKNNLHVVGYSTPVDRWVGLDELKQYIYVQEDQPDVIPYVTSYYSERFGFCMSKNQRDSLTNGKYHMVIKSELFNGVLNFAEIVIPGLSDKEVFFSTYVCHPSMANNECSGPALSTELIKHVNGMKDRRYTYRFVFVPETIGSLTYLSYKNTYIELKDKMIAGFNLSCVGDNNDYSIIESRYANTLADRVLNNVLYYYTDDKYSKYSYLKRGSDERQYNAPGIDLPVVCFCRSKFGEFPEYHTSADNMSYVSPEGFQGSYEVIKRVILALENNYHYKVSVLGEPQLGKRNMYPSISKKGSYADTATTLDLIAYADGQNDLIGISNVIHKSIDECLKSIRDLIENDLIDIIE